VRPSGVEAYVREVVEQGLECCWGQDCHCEQNVEKIVRSLAPLLESLLEGRSNVL
jgi:hypothetical protein